MLTSVSTKVRYFAPRSSSRNLRGNLRHVNSLHVNRCRVIDHASTAVASSFETSRAKQGRLVDHVCHVLLMYMYHTLGSPAPLWTCSVRLIFLISDAFFSARFRWPRLGKAVSDTSLLCFAFVSILPMTTLTESLKA